MANENYDRSRGNTGRSSNTETRSANNRSRRESNESDKRKKNKRAAGVGIGTDITTAILDVFAPGAGSLASPTIKKGFELLSDLDPGTTQEQRARREEARNSNRARPQEAAALPVIEGEADAPATDESNAARVAKRRKKGTKTVLTSPLGATETARTAVAKLGGY